MIGRRSNEPSGEESVEPRGFDAYDLRLGDIMRGERATLGKSLLDVQRELKIKATYIAAIENADPSAFETPGFIAGYVRSYARYLGLDSEWAYDTFCREGNFSVSHGMSPAASGATNKAKKKETLSRDPLADPDAIFVPRSQAALTKIQPGALGSVAVLLLLVGGIGYGGWSVLQEIQRVQFAPIDQAPGVVADLDAGGATPTAPSETEVAALATAPSPDVLDRLYRPQALDVPVLVARDGPIAAIDPSTTGALAGLPRPDLAEEELPAVAQAAPDPIDAPVQVVEADVPDLVLFAVRPSWVRVSAADGTVLLEKILDGGERYVLAATEEAPTLRAGNAGSVYFAVNGQAYGPAGNGPTVVKNIPLSTDGITGSYALADLEKDSLLAEYVRVAQAEGVMIEQAPPATE